MENEIIAILDLSKEEAMLTAGLFALLFASCKGWFRLARELNNSRKERTGHKL